MPDRLRSNVLHVQRQRLAGGVFAAILAMCAALLGGAIIPGLPPALRIVLLVGAASFLLIVLEFDRLTVVLTDAELVVRFHVLRSRTPIAEIERARPLEVKLFSHGIGVHFTSGGALAMTARTGRGIEIGRKGRRPIVASCEDPQALLGALAAAGARGVSPA